MDLPTAFGAAQQGTKEFLDMVDSILPMIDDDNLRRLVEDLRTTISGSHAELEKAFPKMLDDLSDRLSDVVKTQDEAKALADQVEAGLAELAKKEAAAAVPPMEIPQPPPIPARTPYVIPAGPVLRDELVRRYGSGVRQPSAESTADELESWVYNPSAAALSLSLTTSAAPQGDATTPSESLSWSKWMGQSQADQTDDPSAPAPAPKKEPKKPGADRDWGDSF